MATEKQLHVSDMEGKEFKFVQSAEGQKVLARTGFSTAFIGTAHWGPISEAVRITKGEGQFTGLFGDVSPEIDDGHRTALHGFKKSAWGYFSRIADSTEAKSSAIITQAATSPTKESAVGPFALEAGVSDALTIDLKNSTGGVIAQIPVTFTGSTLGNAATVSIDTAGMFPLQYLNNDYLEININGTVYHCEWVVASTDYASAAAFVADIAVDETSIAWSGNNNPFKDLTEAGAIISEAAGIITITTRKIGSTSSITTVADLATGTPGGNGPFAAGTSDFGEDSNTTDIKAAINTALGAHGACNYDLVSTKFSITSVYTSSQATITIGGTADTVLGFGATVAAGVDLKQLGKFEAFYTGRDGNRIKLIFANGKLNVYFRDVLIKTIESFSFTSTDANFIETILTDNKYVNTIITYTHGAANGVGFEDGDWPATFTQILAGGVSGDEGLGANYDTLVANAATAINDYKSFNFYGDLDLMVAPKYSEQTIQDALLDVCSTRMDCFTLLDTPEGLTPENAMSWANGGGFGRTTKLNSYFGACYFPFVKLRSNSFKSASDGTIESKLADHSPLTRVAGAFISRATNVNVFSPVAGAIKGKLEDIEGVQYRLSPEEIKDLYADERNGMINPINFAIEDGYYIDGQRTLDSKNAEGKYTALSRIDVVKSALFLKKSIQAFNKYFYWEPGDSTSWETFGKLIEGLMVYMESKRIIEPKEGQYGWKVISDATVNVPNVTNNYGMVVVIEYYPIKSIEKIKVFSNIKEKDVEVKFELI